jgi:putative Holliday junction resolvase
MPSYDRLLGFDFGTKKIGCAYGQTLTGTARALKTLKNLNGNPDWQQIELLIKEWCPQAFVVGLPLNMDSSEQNVTELARIFSKQLEKKFSLPCFLCDERLSTVEARAELFAEGGYKALQGNQVDAVAAKIILESWMALQN